MALNPNDTELLGISEPASARPAPGKRGAELLRSRRSPATRAIPAITTGFWRSSPTWSTTTRRAESLIRQAALEKFPLYHFVAAVIYAQLGMAPEAAEARDAFSAQRPTIFERWDDEMAKRNYRPEDGALSPKAPARPASQCRHGRPRKQPFRPPLTSADRHRHHVNYTMLQARTLRRC